MHQYLRAIGFSRIHKYRDIRPLLDHILLDPEVSVTVSTRDETFGYLSQSFGDGFGLRLYADFETGNDPRLDYFFPYADSPAVSSTAYCSVEPHTDKNAFYGMCEEDTLGVDLIFYVNNGMDYIKHSVLSEPKIHGVSLTAMSLSGKILLPLKKTVRERELVTTVSNKRSALISAARSGDQDAMEDLAMDDMMMMQNVVDRLGREDLYSLVDTSFAPFSMECDQYAILAEILTCELTENKLTGEEIWRMTVECNNIRMGLLINRRDLFGEPAPGRRFKGDVWLQGRLHLQPPDRRQS